MLKRSIVTLFLFWGAALAYAQSTITLDGNGTGKIFQGLGGVSAGASSRLLIDYPEPYRSQILDYLFKPNYGAGIQHLKVELGGDMNSTDGAEPSFMHTATDQNFYRGYEWWLIQQAKLRNPNITLEVLAWGAPGWIGNGTFFSQDMINYIIRYIQGAKTNYGYSIDEVGIWNETPFNANWIVNLKTAILQAGLPTKVVAADLPAGDLSIINAMAAYSSLMSAVDIIGIHYPTDPKAYSLPLQGQALWDTEDGPWRGDWTGAAFLAKLFNTNYIGAQITLTEIWSMITSYYDVFLYPGSGMMYANTPWSGNYNVQPAIWAMAHTTQFAQPGWQYIDSACGNLASGSYVTLKNGSDYSMIIQTVDAAVSQTLAFRITGGLSTGTVHVWKSDANNQFVQQSDINPAGGSFTITLAPGSIYSLTTTTGQSKGNAVPPPASAFPLPYSDNFDNYSVGQEAKYFSAVNGSFEIADCAAGRGGLCLRQAANAAPIPWHSIGPFEPASILGASNWTDYQVSADVYFEQPGDVMLIGRMSGENVNAGNLNAYHFYLGSAGAWSLRHGNFDYISSGVVSLNPNTWHTMTLICTGAQIQGLVDGVVVTRVTDAMYSSGYAGLGVEEWANAQFDNFRVDLPAGAAQTVPQYQMTATATSQATGYEASKAIDGSTSSFWITAFSCTSGCAPTAPLPQSITLALGGPYNVNNLRYLPRQDGNANGNITGYSVSTSTDGVNFTTVASGTWGSDSSQKNAGFSAVTASYIRLQALAACGGYAAASEIHVDYTIASANNPQPAAAALSPSSITAGQAGLTLSVSGSNFVNGAVVQWNGAGRPTAFASSTVLTATIAASDIASAGTAIVTVVNPAPGGGASNSQTFTINAVPVTPPPGTGTGSTSQAPGFITGYSVSGRTVRNNFSGWVGAKLTVGSNALNVTLVGRLCLSGNSRPHTVKFVNAGTAQDVLGGSAVVNMAGCAPGQFVYAALSSAINLPSGAAYYLVSQETTGSDTWYDVGAVSTASDATVNNAVYSYNGAWYPNSGANMAYVPPNFQYSVSAVSLIPVTVRTNVAGASFIVDGASYSASQVLNWVPGSPHVIAVSPTQSGGTGTQYVWNNWSDGGAYSHTVAPTTATTFSATLATQYLLTTNISPAASGTITVIPTSATGYYNSGALVQVTAVPASSYLFLNWSGDVSGTSTSQTLVMSAPHTVTGDFQAPVGSRTTVSGPGFVTGYSAAGRAVRNDYAGWVGMKLTVGASALNIASLGRLCLAGNSASHTVKFVDATTGQDVGGGSAAVNMAGCTGGQFVYTALAAVITLPPGAAYYLVTQEFAGGDTWYDLGGISAAGDAAVNGAIYSYNGAWYPNGSANMSYVPPNFQYSVSAISTPPVSTPSSGAAANGSATSYITVTTEAGWSVRNDFNGWVGTRLTVGKSALTVTSIGRLCLPGNTNIHPVKFVTAYNGQDLSGGSASINMAGCSAGQFVYAALPAAVALPPGTTYYLVSDEVSGGDTWHDLGALSTTGDATISSAVYSYNGVWYVIGGNNMSYVPPNFQYVAGN